MAFRSDAGFASRPRPNTLRPLRVGGVELWVGKRHRPKYGGPFTTEAALTPDGERLIAAIRVRRDGQGRHPGTFIHLARPDPAFLMPVFILVDELAWCARHAKAKVWPKGVDGEDGRLQFKPAARSDMIHAVAPQGSSPSLRIGVGADATVTPEQPAAFLEIVDATG